MGRGMVTQCELFGKLLHELFLSLPPGFIPHSPSHAEGTRTHDITCAPIAGNPAVAPAITYSLLRPSNISIVAASAANTPLANEMHNHLEPPCDLHQLEHTYVPWPEAVVDDKFSPTTGYLHVTTLNMQHGVPLLARATLQLKSKISGCQWKTSSSIFRGKSLFTSENGVSDDN